jgi:hypothetical protein
MPPAESDLTPLNDQQWQRLESALEFERTSSDPGSIAAATIESRSARELWPLLLAGVAILSCVELMLARIGSEERSA